MKARNKAWNCLIQIMKDGKYSNLVLRHELDQVVSSQRGLITQIVYGTLQNYRLVRYQWVYLVKQVPIIEIAILLDMSVYQLLYMKQAPYAVIDEAVDASKRIKGGQFSNLVNAVLRKVLDRGEAPVAGDEWEVLAITTSHPDWLVKMWNAQYGEATCRMICHHDQGISPQAIRVNTLKTTVDDFLSDNGDFMRHPLLSNILLMKGGVDKDLFEGGYFSIQNTSSQLMAPFLGPQPKERILDICAAPGTKTCHIAQLMQDDGEIIACDLHDHRVELIKQGAERLGMQSIQAMQADGTQADTVFESNSFDRILIDAPCSGYGTLQGKSDIRIRMKSEDMDGIIKTQEQILNACAELLKPGGTLVYSTCTLNKKENEKQVETFLKKYETYTLKEMRTVFPDEYDSDGFFMAKLMKTSD